MFLVNVSNDRISSYSEKKFGFVTSKLFEQDLDSKVQKLLQSREIKSLQCGSIRSLHSRRM
jgi:hypothetical protein